MIVLKNILNMVTHFVMFSFSFKHHTSKKNFEHIFVVLLMCFEPHVHILISYFYNTSLGLSF